MAYAAWSVSFGEQPSTAKWNILGTNDASFNDGTGIANLATNVTSISNPYKFYAYRNAAHTSSSSFTKIAFDTEVFDTNNNFDSTSGSKGRYTAPVNGFYWFSACAGNSSGAASQCTALYKNGSQLIQGNQVLPGSGGTLLNVSGLFQLTAANYVEAYFLGGAGTSMYASQQWCYFQGFLVSQT